MKRENRCDRSVLERLQRLCNNTSRAFGLVHAHGLRDMKREITSLNSAARFGLNPSEVVREAHYVIFPKILSPLYFNKDEDRVARILDAVEPFSSYIE
jgi:hypothetical protein